MIARMLRTSFSHVFWKCARSGVLCLIAVLLPAQTQNQVILPRSQLVLPPGAPVDSSAASYSKPFRVNVDLVLVPVTVTDPQGRIVIGLGKEHFQVLEDKESQVIRHFSCEDAPVSLGVIFDASGSMVSKIERAREAVAEFFKTANPHDEIFVITFSEKPEEIADFSDALDSIQSKMIYAVPKGRTALLDAIYLGISRMRQAQYARKALLILSDGGDNHSRYTENDIKSVVREADTLIYAIGIYDHYFPTVEEQLGPLLLSELAEATGGRAFVVENPNDLANIAIKIGLELRNQYVLGYQPRSPKYDGKWRRLKVKVSPPKGLPHLQVRAKQGYYSPSQ